MLPNGESAAKQSIFSDFKNLKKLWPYLKINKNIFFLTIIFVPLISLFQILTPLIMKNAIDEGIIKNDISHLITMAAVFATVVVAEYFVRVGQLMATNISVGRMIMSLRHNLVNHIMHLSANFHDKSLSGALVTRATSDFDNLSESLNQGVLQSLVDLIILASCIIGMFTLNWQLALFAVSLLPIILWIVKSFSQAIKASLMEARKHLAALNAFTQECLFGISTIKTLNAEDSALYKFQQINEKFRHSQMKSVSYDAFLYSVLDGMASIVMGFILWLVVDRFTDQTWSTGLIIAFIRYIQQMFDPLKQLGSTMAMLQGVFTAIDRIFSILETKDFIHGTTTPSITKGHIEFDHVTYSYPGNQTKVLNNLSFEVRAGSSLAIVGRTGSGKSTIIKILAKLYEGYEGHIKIDGHNLAEIEPFWLRKQIAIVPQDIILFAGSIRYNIALGRENVSDYSIREAIKTVGAERFINSLPNQLDFELTEQGLNLSHGQRQLIVFARALATQPSLIILDEATSVMDKETEATIQIALKNILASKTVIVIAHRLDTIKNCDAILVLDKGRKAEWGTHFELLAQKGVYFQLYHGLQDQNEITSAPMFPLIQAKTK